MITSTLAAAAQDPGRNHPPVVARVEACPARAADCRCAGYAGHEYVGGAGLHTCSAPGCGALWAGGSDGRPVYPVRLPMALTYDMPRRRLYPVPSAPSSTEGVA